MSAKSLPIIVEMKTDTLYGNSVRLRTTCLRAVEFSGSHLTKTVPLIGKTRTNGLTSTTLKGYWFYAHVIKFSSYFKIIFDKWC